MSVKRLGVGFIFGVLLVAIGLYSLYDFVSIDYGPTAQVFGGLGCIVFGSALIKATYHIFITPKENNLTPVRVCPHCGAIVAKNARVCKKCKQPLR
ncbi:MAG: hypothetical protein ACM3UY_04030 [Methanocella sp.]